MSPARFGPPTHPQALRKRLSNHASGDQALTAILVRTVATVAVGQLLPWSAVKGGTAMKLRIGHDELGDTVDAPLALAPEISELFSVLGLPAPEPLPAVAHDHQVAQKLHGLSEPGSERAHDLVDLQLLAHTCDLPDLRVAQTCVRLFAFRRGHLWPPVVTAGTDWPSLYREAAVGLDVLPLEPALEWVNAYIARLNRSRS